MRGGGGAGNNGGPLLELDAVDGDDDESLVFPRCKCV